jgi:hypothetical protein
MKTFGGERERDAETLNEAYIGSRRIDGESTVQSPSAFKQHNEEKLSSARGQRTEISYYNRTHRLSCLHTLLQA